MLHYQLFLFLGLSGTHNTHVQHVACNYNREKVVAISIFIENTKILEKFIFFHFLTF